MHTSITNMVSMVPTCIIVILSCLVLPVGVAAESGPATTVEQITGPDGRIDLSRDASVDLSTGARQIRQAANGQPYLADMTQPRVALSPDTGACGDDGWHTNFVRAGQISASTLEIVAGVLYVGGQAT
ncbi:hypothetical protein GF420_06505, partial [candidate division GN15 bacterium]|nr:hypothetical protein [candidate division GN15 bacterium]